MFKLKGAIEKANGLYNNLRENDEETLKIKDMLKKTYTEYTNCDTMVTLFSDNDNYEIYSTDLFTHPIVCVFKNDVLEKVYGNDETLGCLSYFEDKDCTKIVFPVIIISELLCSLNNKVLLNYIISHELGHYRKNHVSNLYPGDKGDRDILKEVEADLYTCEILGVEGCINGLRELARYLITEKPNADVEEVLKRLAFISRKYNISGVLDEFKLKEECKE